MVMQVIVMVLFLLSLKLAHGSVLLLNVPLKPLVGEGGRQLLDGKELLKLCPYP
jgi:uncharacterized membrane protein